MIWLADSFFQQAQTISNVLDFFRIQGHGHSHGDEGSHHLPEQLTVAGHIRPVGQDFHLRRAEQVFKYLNHAFLVCHLPPRNLLALGQYIRTREGSTQILAKLKARRCQAFFYSIRSYSSSHIILALG
jgi:hypothetical protein